MSLDKKTKQGYFDNRVPLYSIMREPEIHEEGKITKIQILCEENGGHGIANCDYCRKIQGEN
jgi:hypothetical protein